LGRIGESRSKEVFGQMVDVDAEKVFGSLELLVEDRVGVRAGEVVNGNVAVKNVRKKQSRGTVTFKIWRQRASGFLCVWTGSPTTRVSTAWGTGRAIGVPEAQQLRHF
jgi:hypothetical protein